MAVCGGVRMCTRRLRSARAPWVSGARMRGASERSGRRAPSACWIFSTTSFGSRWLAVACARFAKLLAARSSTRRRGRRRTDENTCSVPDLCAECGRVRSGQPFAHMRNVFWLRPGVIGGRTGPNYDAWDPKDLAAGGIGAVLSVNDGELVRPDELAAAGIDYCCVPLSDAAPPQLGDLEICVSA